MNKLIDEKKFLADLEPYIGVVSENLVAIKNIRDVLSKHLLTAIPLSKGKWAIVDEEDYTTLNKHNWHITASGYAVRRIQGQNYGMHRQILGLKKGEYCDHVNGDKLDNRKENLRKATPSQNMMNRKVGKNSKSGYKGVIWRPTRSKWQAYIRLNKKNTYLGLYKDKKEAARAYNQAASDIYGQYARLNNV